MDAVLNGSSAGGPSADSGAAGLARKTRAVLAADETFRPRFGSVTIYPPSTLDLNKARQVSSTMPRAKLRLGKFATVAACRWGFLHRFSTALAPALVEHVHGYAGCSTTCPNLFFTATGDLAFYTAGLGVVSTPGNASFADTWAGAVSGSPSRLGAASASYSKPFSEEPGFQRFFREHDDDVTCLAVHPSGRMVATGQTGEEPFVSIWDQETMRSRVRLRMGKGMRSVVACAFGGPGGQFLVTVCTDNDHTVMVWDWATNRKLCEANGRKGTPPQVYGVLWDSHTEVGRFATYGASHVLVSRADRRWLNESLWRRRLPSRLSLLAPGGF